MKRILILSLGRTGSLPFYAENIAKNFNNLDYTLVLSKNRINRIETRNAIEITTYYNKITFVVNTLFYLPFLLLWFIPRIHKQYDTLYLPYKHFWDIPFIFLFRILGKKVFFTVHDGVLHHGEKNFFTQGLNNIRLKMSSELIFLTNFVKETVKNVLAIDKKSVIIPHPIIENSFINFNHKTKRSKNVLFLGRIDQYKGVELLMDAVLLIKNDIDKLIVAGKSQYDIKYKLDSKIEIRDKYLSEQDMGELLTWADLLVLPYTEASQSGVIALGVYAELPMLCTNVGGFKEQLNDDECFWCEPTVKSISQNIKNAFAKPQHLNEIVMKIKKKKDSMSYKNISLKIEEILFKN